MSRASRTTLSSAPFLVWPVARREFYGSLAIALAPTLIWGVVLFGWRAAGLIVAAAGTASLTHVLLKRWTVFGRVLAFPHTLTSALMLTALCWAAWPAWVVAGLALLLPLLLAAVGGPGKERVHIAVILAIVLQGIILPLLPNGGIFGGPSAALLPQPAILAQDRLVMGDIRSQSPGSFYHWPNSVELQGNDALRLMPPEVVAHQTLDEVATETRAAATAARGSALMPATAPVLPRSEIRRVLDSALSMRLEGLEMVLLGVAPGAIGRVSLAGIILGGLYLAYRSILRIRSVTLFLGVYALALGAMTVPLGLALRGDFHLIYRLAADFPGDLATLAAYLFLTSDALFAAVFLLALPGTEPLSPRGRTVFIMTAAALAAIVTRFGPAAGGGGAWGTLPAATLVLTVMMPLAPMFDRWFARRSWLSSG